jgi:hypothetical protein
MPGRSHAGYFAIQASAPFTLGVIQSRQRRFSAPQFFAVFLNKPFRAEFVHQELNSRLGALDAIRIAIV